MPSPILHLTHAEMLAAESALPEPVRTAMTAEAPYAKLGSIFPDLSFYTKIIPMTLDYWLEREPEDCPLAVRMHSDRPHLFAWHLLETVSRDELLTERQRLALLGGFFAHVALDLEIHPLVNWCARRDVALYGGHEAVHHRLAEKYQSLFFHVDRDGADCLGTQQFYRHKSPVLERPSFFRLRETEPVVQWVSKVLGFYDKDGPSPRQVAKFLRTYRHFSFLVSLRVTARNSRRLGHADNRRRYYQNEAFDFRVYWDRGYKRSIQMVTLAYNAFMAADFSPAAQAPFVAAANISDLATPPEPSDLPPLVVTGDQPELEPVPA